MEITAEQVEAVKRLVGRRATLLRERAGYSNVPAAAKALGVKNPTLYDIEKGQNFLSPEMLLKMSEAYGVSIDAFFADSQAPKAASEGLEIIARLTRLLSAIDANPALLREVELVVESAAHEAKPEAPAVRRRR